MKNGIAFRALACEHAYNRQCGENVRERQRVQRYVTTLSSKVNEWFSDTANMENWDLNLRPPLSN